MGTNRISYGRQLIDDDDIASVVAALKSDFLTQGPAVTNFERAICDYTGAKYCVAVANATAGLHIAVASLRLEEGSEGITSPNTFLASSNCFVYNGLTPVFADINPETYCISPSEIERKLTGKTKVLIPVHFAGQSADMKRIGSIASRNSLRVIEDAAHAIGSVDDEGNKIGSCVYSDMTVFSFHPVKTITTGEGGAVTTNDPALYQRLLDLRSHGITKDTARMTSQPGPWYYEMQSLGFNYRLTDIQAALGVSQLRKLDAYKKRRKEIVRSYNASLKEYPNVKIPFETTGADSCFHLYVIQIDFDGIGKTRAEVMDELFSMGIGTQVHYIPVHLQPYYRERYGTDAGDFPIAESYYARALSLPLYPGMDDEDVSRVIEAVKAVCVKK